MAFDAFLKLDGIKGESNDSKHPGEIVIQSFSWGVSNTGTFSSSTGAGAGRAAFQDFSFTADTGSASPPLFLASASGQHIKSGVITLRSKGAEPRDFYTVTISDVLVSAYNQGGSTGGEQPMDQFSLNFAKIEVAYNPQGADGSSETAIRAGWDIKTNTKA